jgi:hypothetical protein
MHETICDFLLDIIQNAIEAEASAISVTVADDANHVRFSVTDDGKGMSISELGRIRDPFYTDGTKHVRRKIGLGIPFLQQAVSMTDGEFEIFSEPGKGTRITCSFPADHIDTPPVGNLPSAFLAALTYPGDFDMHIVYSIERGSVKDGYELHRSELIEILGDLHMGQSLIMLRDFIQSQDESLENIRGAR